MLEEIDDDLFFGDDCLSWIASKFKLKVGERCPVCDVPMERIAGHHDHFHDLYGKIQCEHIKEVGTSDSNGFAVPEGIYSWMLPCLATFLPETICASCNTLCATFKAIIKEAPSFVSLSPYDMRRFLDKEDPKLIWIDVKARYIKAIKRAIVNGLPREKFLEAWNKKQKKLYFGGPTVKPQRRTVLNMLKAHPEYQSSLDDGNVPRFIELSHQYLSGRAELNSAACLFVQQNTGSQGGASSFSYNLQENNIGLAVWKYRQMDKHVP